MYGINAGYDSRPMATGGTDTGIPTFGTEKTVFFQQVAAAEQQCLTALAAQLNLSENP